MKREQYQCLLYLDVFFHLFVECKLSLIHRNFCLPIPYGNSRSSFPLPCTGKDSSHCKGSQELVEDQSKTHCLAGTQTVSQYQLQWELTSPLHPNGKRWEHQETPKQALNCHIFLETSL